VPEVRLAVPALAARMRAAGARVGVGEVLAAHRALTSVDPADRGDAYFALRAVLCSSRRDLALFDAAWAATFPREAPQVDEALAELMEAARTALPRTGVPAETPQPGLAPGDAVPVAAPFSDEELLRTKDFAAYTSAERAAARALLERLARRGPQRRSRRTRPTARRRDVHDLRATVRASLRHGGELVEWRYRADSLRRRPMVLIVDVSGSMAPYARMLLQYTQAAVAARRRVEAFAFGTRRTRITRELHGRDPDRALARATERVVDMGGGTRIGAALSELNRVHGRRLGRGSVVVILSDGWDRGEPELLGAEMARLRRSAHRLVWLNPLAADERYAPLTRGMLAALPHTDDLLAGNSIASLEVLAGLLEEIR
jgi:uncharacterized protein with von Willebrand factor type A (vWA) domain